MDPSAAQESETIAFEAFYRSAVGPVYSYARRRVGDDAEDVVAEVFHAAVIAVREGRSDQLTLPWVMTVCRNKVIDRWRKAGRRKAIHQLMPKPEVATFPEDWYRNPAEDAVLTALDHLSQRHRTLLILHHIDGMTISDIAESAAMTPSAVESALARARQSFRRHYSKERL